jgi:hypothetical protein
MSLTQRLLELIGSPHSGEAFKSFLEQDSNVIHVPCGPVGWYDFLAKGITIGYCLGHDCISYVTFHVIPDDPDQTFMPYADELPMSIRREATRSEVQNVLGADPVYSSPEGGEVHLCPQCEDDYMPTWQDNFRVAPYSYEVSFATPAGVIASINMASLSHVEEEERSPTSDDEDEPPMRSSDGIITDIEFI